MLSKEPRCVYEKNPLIQVICQIRFPEITMLRQEFPSAFYQEVVREFPEYRLQKEPVLPGVSGMTVNNYEFATEDGIWKLNLTSRFLSLSCSHYTRWEHFAAHLDRPLAAFLTIYKPETLDRIGLRYINAISRAELGLEDYLFSDLISNCYLGVMSEQEIVPRFILRSGVDAEVYLSGGCRVKLHAGPGVLKNQKNRETRFLFDQDVFMPGSVEAAYIANCLETLHKHAFSLFRGAIEDPLHEAMEPEYVKG